MSQPLASESSATQFVVPPVDDNSKTDVAKDDTAVKPNTPTGSALSAIRDRSNNPSPSVGSVQGSDVGDKMSEAGLDEALNDENDDDEEDDENDNMVDPLEPGESESENNERR